ncbi:MAG: penicillin acylase family protein [Chitinophagaceae bacterium]|nr:penicillin acylase family protein [Chitinophagaceae bacterium]
MKIMIHLFLLTFLLSFNASAQSTIDPAKIEIVRDSFGVPHIFAKTDAEVAYGLAWAHAEDDFKSLQDIILPAKGLMGRVQGKAGAAGDYAFALFRCKEITEEKWNTLSPAFLQLIDGYVQGINAYAKAHPNEVLHKKIFPITTKEYISSSVLALTVFNGADKALMGIFNNAIETDPELNKKGSNAIAVHPTKTNTGEAFLLINAHQPNTGSQAFYEAHINSEEGLNVHGGLLAGGPCILHGVNENLGWAHTVNYVDRVDVFQLEMNPANEKQYKFDGEWIELEEKTITLRIKGIPVGVKRKVYWSKYGATMKNKQGYFSIRLGANMDIRALEQWYAMDKAKNFTEFYAAIKDQRLSMFNITYADKYDTIFYVNNGLVPVRNPSPKYNWKSTVAGNTSQTLWTGFRKFSELPQYVNPKSGYLFNTNHSPFFATAAADNLNANQFPAADGWETWHNNRSMRVVEQMPTAKLDYTSFKQIKFDKQLPATLRYPHNIDTMFLLNETDYPQFATVIKHLKAWDKKGTADSKGAAVFLLSYLHLSKKLSMQAPRSITKNEAVETYAYAHDYMIKHFNTTDLTLGDLQKLVRGNKEWPLWGFPDLLSPQWTAPYKDGKLKSVGGDGLIMFIRFQKNTLPQIETVNMYGASAKPGNKHFDDQVEMYLQQKTKKMTLNKEEVYKNAERVYHPGE